MSLMQSAPGERCFTLFGLTLTTAHRFENRVCEVEGPADLWFRAVEASPIDPSWREAEPAFRSAGMIDRTQHFLDVVLTPAATVFHFSEVIDFYVLPDGIAYQLLDEDYAFTVELYLLGFILSYWLERAGWPALHASAVVVGDRGVGFLSQHGGGKTSLAATLLLAGFPLLADDILALTAAEDGFTGRPGYPQMRMWPEQARHFLGRDDLDLVHPKLTKRRVPVGTGGLGHFDGKVRRMAALYIPQRREGGDIEITTLRPSEALLELVRHSFLTGIVEGIGLAVPRFKVLGRVVGAVPVRLLSYPNGLERLPEVAQRIVDDVRST